MVVYSPVGRISGAHLNPAVSFAFLLERKLGVIEFVMFSSMQILGSIFAAYLALLVWSKNALKVNIGMTLPGEGYSIVSVFLVEVFITFLLVGLIFYFLHSRSLTRFAGIAVGLLIAILVFLTAPVTGTSLNPARSIGPALASFNFSYIWLYIIAFIAVTIRRKIAFLHCPLCAKLNHRKKDKKCMYDCKFEERK
jgi:aquaporin Z